MQTLTKPVSHTRRSRSWFRSAVEHPRRLWVRRAFFQVHLWAGLLVGLQATIIGLTGSAIVFQDSLAATLQPALYRGIYTRSLSGDLDAMRAAVQRALPGRAVLDASPRDSGVWVFRVQDPHCRYRTYAFVDPSTNRYLGAQVENQGFLNRVAFLHYELLGGDTGRIVNGIGAVLPFMVSLTGMVLWWPGRKHWKRALIIRWSARPARLTGTCTLRAASTRLSSCLCFRLPALTCVCL